jgi:hypothetical protein
VVLLGADQRHVTSLVSPGTSVERMPIPMVGVLLFRVLPRPHDDVRVPREPVAFGAPDQVLSGHGQHHAFCIYKVVHGDGSTSGTLPIVGFPW